MHPITVIKGVAIQDIVLSNAERDMLSRLIQSSLTSVRSRTACLVLVLPMHCTVLTIGIETDLSVFVYNLFVRICYARVIFPFDRPSFTFGDLLLRDSTMPGELTFELININNKKTTTRSEYEKTLPVCIRYFTAQTKVVVLYTIHELCQTENMYKLR